MWLVAPETRAQASSATEEGRGCEQGQEQAQAKADQGVQGEGIVAPALVIVSPILRHSLPALIMFITFLKQIYVSMLIRLEYILRVFC